MTYDMFNQPLSTPWRGRSIRSRGRTPARSQELTQLRSENGHRRHDRDLPEIRVGRKDAFAAGGSGGHRNLYPGRTGWCHAGGRPDCAAARSGCRPTRWTAARPTRRSCDRRAGLLPGIRTGRIPRLDRLCQPEDHQRRKASVCNGAIRTSRAQLHQQVTGRSRRST